SSPNWLFNASVSTLAWQDGLSYQLQTSARDNATGAGTPNQEAPVAAINFTYDTTKPTVAVQFPTPAGPKWRSLATISGTSADTNIRKVELRIVRDQGGGSLVYADPGNGLNFTQPTSDLAWFDATYAVDWTNWSVSSGGVTPFIHGSTYAVIA